MCITPATGTRHCVSTGCISPPSGETDEVKLQSEIFTWRHECRIGLESHMIQARPTLWARYLCNFSGAHAHQGPMLQ